MIIILNDPNCNCLEEDLELERTSSVDFNINLYSLMDIQSNNLSTYLSIMTSDGYSFTPPTLIV